MKKAIPFVALFLAAAAVPSAARAETAGFRIGLEAPLYTHFSRSGVSQSYNIGDTLQPAINVLLSYKPDPVLSFDIEGIEGFTSTGDRTASGVRKYARTGTAIGPGITLSAPVLPLYARASLPIHVEPSPVTVGLRTAGGLSFSLVAVSLYVEAALDFSLAGTDVSAFDKQVVSGGAGLWFRF